MTAPVAHLARQFNAATPPLAWAQIESYVASQRPNLRVMTRAALPQTSKRRRRKPSWARSSQ